MTKSVKTEANVVENSQNLDYLTVAAKDSTLPNALKSENYATYINVLQDLSPQCKSSKPEYISGAKGGMFLNTLTNELLTGPLQVVVLNVEKKHVEWKPNRGGFVKTWSTSEYDNGFVTGTLQRVDGVGIQTLQGNSIETRYEYTMFILNRPDWGLCKLSLSGGNLRTAKRWNFLLTHTLLSGTNLFAAIHTIIWTLKSELVSNDRGEWYSINPVFEEFVNPEMLSLTTDMTKLCIEINSGVNSIEASGDENF